MTFPRRSLLAAGLAAALLAANPLASHGQADGPAPATKPNILFIAVDDLKPTLGAYGDQLAQTPNLDALARRSTTFSRAYCQQAVCGPSRASLMTGLYPDTNGVHKFHVDMREAKPDVVSLPEHLAAHGYETVGTGKIYDPRNIDNREMQDAPSWTKPYVHENSNAGETFGYLAPENVKIIVPRKKEAQAQGITGWTKMLKFINHHPPFESADVPDEAYNDGVRAKVGARLVRELAAEDKPYFLAVGFNKPHLPFNAPTKYWDLYDPAKFQLAKQQVMPEGAPEFHFQDSWELRSGYTHVPPRGTPVPPETARQMIHGYYACVSFIDAQIGELIAAVEASGEADNTIIILWGDHGWHLGDHGMWCKHTNYEQATRVPLFILAPMMQQKPGMAGAPVELIDMFPTLCDLAGVPIPDVLDGDSLKPILADPDASVKPFAMSQFPRRLDEGSVEGYAFRDERYRYITWRRPGEDGTFGAGETIARELYDYETDPLETRNLVTDEAYADVVARFEKLAGAALPKVSE